MFLKRILKRIPKRRQLTIVLAGIFVLVVAGIFSLGLLSGKLSGWADVLTGQTGNIYYLGPNGDDINDGLTQSSALKTINKAFEKLRAGDTLKVLDGTTVVGSTNPFNTDVIGAVLPYAGTASAWITIEAADGASPVIDFAGDRTILIRDDSGYVAFKNLTFTNVRGIALKLYGPHIVFDGCKFRDFYEAIRTADGLQDLTIRNSEFWREYAPAGQEFIYGSIRANGLLMEHNIFYQTVSQGGGYHGWLFKGHAANAEIRYNKFIGSPGITAAATAIYLGGELAGVDTWESVNFNIHDNLFYNWPGLIVRFARTKDLGVV